MSDYTTVSHGSMEVTSNTSTEEQIREALEFPTEADEASEAASKLGKRGGKAAAEARKAKNEDGAEPPSDLGSDKGAKAPEAKEEKKEAKQESKEPAETKPEEKKSRKGDPRSDPEARKAEIASEIRELTNEQKRLRQENERLRQERPKEPEAKPPQKSVKADDDEPVFNEGDDFGEHVKKLASWEAKKLFKQAEATREKKAAQEEAVREVRELHSAYTKRMDAYAEKNPDFYDHLDAELMSLKPAKTLPPSERQEENYVFEELVSSEHAPELLLHFSENPNEFQRLATLHPRQMLREIAKLEVSLSSPPAAATAGNSAPRAPEVSQAKPPVRPVAGSPHTADDDDDPEALVKLPLHRYVEVMNRKDRRAQR